jgi:NitT/TauT family transport system permease protein
MTEAVATAGGAVAPAGRRDLRATGLAILLAALAWEGVVLASGGWVPGVVDILLAMVERLGEAETWQAIGITLGRIAIVFPIALGVGVLIGLAMGLWDWADAFWRPIVALALAIPDPVYFIMAILVIGPGEWVSLMALALAIIPFAVGAVASSMRARDPKLDDMARVFRFSTRARFREVLLPQVAPAIFVSGRTVFAFSWKIGVLMEAMTRSTGVGAEIFFAFRLFRADEMIALALIFIIVMRSIELLILAPLERRTFGWK